MSKKSVNFLTGLEGHDEIRVMPSKFEGHLLVTIGNRRAIDYKLSEKSAVTNFFAPSHISLTTPLGFDHASQNFVCVVNKTDLLFWSGEESHLDKVAVTCKLQVPAIDLVSLDDKTIGVVLENGDLQPVSYLIKKKGTSQHEKCPHSPNAIVKTRIVSHKGAQHCVFIGNNDTIDVHRLAFDVQNECFELHQHVKHATLSHLSDADVVGNKLIGISHGGTVLSVLPLFDNSDEVLENAVKDSYKGSKIIGLNEDHAVLYCSKPDGAALQVVDVNFGTIAAETDVKSASSNHIVAFDRKKVLFKVGSRVACWNLEGLPSGLADLVGKHADKASLAFEDDSIVTWKPLDDPDAPDWISLINEANLSDCVDLLDKSKGHLPDVVKVALVEFLIDKSEDLDVIKKALLMPMSENGILQYLRFTEHRSAKKMISSIIKILQGACNNDEALADQLLVWLDLVLNAHYTNFIVTKDSESRDVLIMCAELMEELDSSVNMLATVMSQMKMMKEKIAIRQAQVSNHIYSVEIVYL